MRNLRKVLALVLALVMVIGVFGVAASAAIDYKDADKVNYTEAIDVMSALKVINGFEDGSIQPQGTLTRAQAAKIIAYMSLGETASAALPQTATKFSDVPATHWASGAIAYCVSQKIIDGFEDGAFRPEDTLTGLQFGKMLAVLVGYGSKGEFVGTNWALEVAKVVIPKGFFKGNSADATNTAMTRESAMNSAFNAMTINKVSYSELLGIYSDNLFGSTGTTTLADNFKLTTKTADDGYGYAGRIWQVNGKDITGVYSTDQIVKTYTSTAGVTGATLYNLGTWKAIPAGKPNAGDTEIVINGVGYTEDLSNLVYKGSSITLSDFVHAVLGTTGGPFNGVSVNVVADPADGEIYKVIITIEYLAKVTNVNAATANAKRSVDLDVFIPGGSTSTTVETDLYAENDYVLIIPSASFTTTSDEPLSLKAAPSVNSTVKSVVESKGTVTLSDGTYTMSNFAADGNEFADLDTVNFNTTYTVYFNSDNYIVGSEVYKAGATSSSYVYVSASSSKAASTNLISGTDAAFKVKVTYMNGTTEVRDYVIKVATSDTTPGGMLKGDSYIVLPNGTNFVVTDTSPIVDGVYGYTLNSAGKITLSDDIDPAPPAASADDATAVSVTKGSSDVAFTGAIAGNASMYATNSTVLTQVINGVVTTYTGRANFPTTTYSTAGGAGTIKVDAVAYTYVGSTVTNILVMGGTAVASADAYGYYIGLGQKTEDGQYYNFFVNGETKGYLTDSVPTSAVTYYALDIDGVNATITAAAVTNSGTAMLPTSVQAGDFIVVDGVSYELDTNSQVVIVNTSVAPTTYTKSSAGSIKTTGTNKDVVVVAYETSGTVNTAKVVYVIR